MLIYFLLFTFLVFCFVIVVCVDWQNKRKSLDNKHRYHIIVDEKELLIEMYSIRKFSNDDFERVKEEISERFDCNKDEIGIIYYGKGQK